MDAAIGRSERALGAAASGEPGLMPRAGLTAESVVAAAGELADEQGLDGVTLAELASRLGVRPPSLYCARGRARGPARAAGRPRRRAARRRAAAGRRRASRRARRCSAVAHAYRAYALAHPGAYAALQRAPRPSDEAAAAAERVVAVVLAVLAGYGLDGEPALHATRAIRSALHGFVALETQQGFGMPLDLEESFEVLVAMLDRGLRAEPLALAALSAQRTSASVRSPGATAISCAASVAPSSPKRRGPCRVDRRDERSEPRRAARLAGRDRARDHVALEALGSAAFANILSDVEQRGGAVLRRVFATRIGRAPQARGQRH